MNTKRGPNDASGKLAQTPLAAAIGWALFHSLWEGAAIALLLAATPRDDTHGTRRYVAASLAMCALLVSFRVTLFQLVPWHPSTGAATNAIAVNWNDGVALGDIPGSAAAAHRRFSSLAGPLLDRRRGPALFPASGQLGHDAAHAKDRRRAARQISGRNA